MKGPTRTAVVCVSTICIVVKRKRESSYSSQDLATSTIYYIYIYLSQPGGWTRLSSMFQIMLAGNCHAFHSTHGTLKTNVNIPKYEGRHIIHTADTICAFKNSRFFCESCGHNKTICHKSCIKVI